MYHLFGLAEGLVGAPTVKAKNTSELFAKFPALRKVRAKLDIKGREVSGFAACDG